MAIHYVKRAMKNPKLPQEQPKYYLIAKSLKAVERDTFIEDMVRHTSLTQSEAASAIDYLFEAFPRYIALGHTVKLGEFGYFKPTILSEGSIDPDDATPDKIRRKRVRFIFGKDVRDKINRIPVTEYDQL